MHSPLHNLDLYVLCLRYLFLPVCCTFPLLDLNLRYPTCFFSALTQSTVDGIHPNTSLFVERVHMLQSTVGQSFEKCATQRRKMAYLQLFLISIRSPLQRLCTADPSPLSSDLSLCCCSSRGLPGQVALHWSLSSLSKRSN